MMRGAIGFSSNQTHLLSRLIVWATKSKWTHVFLIIDDCKVLTVYTSTFEASGFSVHKDKFEKYLKPRMEYEVYILDNTDEAKFSALKEVLTLDGRSYGILQLIGFGLKLLFRGFKSNPVSSGIICSELGWRYLRELRVSGYEKFDKDTVSPAQLREFIITTSGSKLVAFSKND